MNKSLSLTIDTAKPVSFIWSLLLFLSVFGVQYGYNTILNIAVFSLLLMFYFVFSSKSISLQVFYYVLIVLFCYCIYVFVYLDVGYVARELRVLLCGICYFLMLKSRPIAIYKFNYFAAGIAILLSVLCLYQYVEIGRGNLHAVPGYFFVNSDDKVLADTGIGRAVGIGYEFVFRPSVFYSEPSYYGLVMISLLYLVLKLPNTRIKYFVMVSILGGLIAAQTMFGLVGFMLVLISHGFFKSKLLLVLLGMAVLLGGIYFDERVYNIVTLQDQSTVVRLLRPIAVIVEVLSKTPFGIPHSLLDYVVVQKGGFDVGYEGENPFNNAFFAMFMTYGFLGIVVVGLMFSILETTAEKVMLVLFMMQNGGFFAFDKIFLFAFIILVARGAKMSASYMRRPDNAEVME